MRTCLRLRLLGLTPEQALSQYLSQLVLSSSPECLLQSVMVLWMYLFIFFVSKLTVGMLILSISYLAYLAHNNSDMVD